MFISHPRSTSSFLSLSLICVGFVASFDARAGELEQPSVVSQFVKVYNEGLTTLATTLAEAPLTTRERAWVLRQHRALKMRAEIQLDRILCPADIELLRQDIRSLAEAIEAIKSHYVFAHKAQLDVHP